MKNDKVEIKNNLSAVNSQFSSSLREPFDYTEWRKGLFADVPLDEFLQAAADFRKEQDEKDALRKRESGAPN